MLRSRRDGSGRFQRSPTMASCMYLSNAGKTIRTSSNIGTGRRAFELSETAASASRRAGEDW